MRTFGANVFASPNQVVKRAIFLSTACVGDRVSVAGPDGLAAMVALCREGFDRVECARQATCGGADDVSDVMLIVGPMDSEDLTATVRRTARLLRDGGRLVVQLMRAGDDPKVRAVLASMGVTVTATLIDRSCGRLATYTVRRPAALRRAS